jgi:hypothetical protein
MKQQDQDTDWRMQLRFDFSFHVTLSWYPSS